MQIAKCTLQIDQKVCNLQFAFCNLHFAILSAVSRSIGLIFLATAVFLVACTPSVWAATPDDDYGAVADFSLTERAGQVIQRAHLAGKVWVAAFIFTRCAGPCAQVSGSMADLQRSLLGNSDVVLVSFTVD